MFTSFTKTTVLVFFTVVQLAVFATTAQAQIEPTPELNADQLSFDYMSSNGEIWHDCTVTKDLERHDFIAMCNGTRFRIHIFIRSWINQQTGDSTYEMHYWADRFKDDPNNYMDSATQSTWLTVENGAQIKKFVSYVGFDDDSFQLRVEVKF